MKIFMLIVFATTVFSCAEKREGVDLKRKHFFSVDSISHSATPSILDGTSLQDKEIYNNKIVHSNIKDSTRTVLTSSGEDVEAVMGKNSRIGFFQADTQAVFYHYSGNFFSAFISKTQRDIFLRARYSTSMVIGDSASVIIIDNDTALAVYPVNSRINIAGNDIYPGNKVHIFGDSRIEQDTVTTKEVDFFVNWLTIGRVYPLVSAVRERWAFPVLEKFIDEALVKTAIRHSLSVRTRHAGDSVSVIPVNVPRGATFRNDTLLWRPTTKGTHVFNFKLVAGLDTASIYRRVRVIGALAPDVSLHSQRGRNNDFEIVFDFSGARSFATGDRALSFRIVSDDINTGWFTDRQKRFTTAQRGKKSFTIHFRAISGEEAVVRRNLILEDPPVIEARVSPEYIFQHDTIKVALSGTKDDNTSADQIRVVAEFIHDGNAINTLRGSGNSVFETVLGKVGKWEVALTATDLAGNRSQKRVPVNVGEGINVQIQDVHRGVINRYMVVPIHVRGDNVDSIFVDFNEDGIFDHRGIGPNFRAQAIYAEEGEYKISVKVTDRGGKQYTFLSRAIIESSPTTLVIKPPEGRLSVNQSLGFRVVAENPHRMINSVKCDFNSDGIWDFETQNERRFTAEYRRSGTYVVRCKATTDAGHSVYDSVSVEIKNTPPKIGKLRDIAPRVRERVTIRGTAVDPDAKKLEYAWDTNGDGIFDVRESSFSSRFEKYTRIVLRVMDDDSAFAYDTMNVVICPSDMVLVEDGPYCIDKYEFPNTRHEVPTNNITYSEAVEFCRAKGKRMCTEVEWIRACRGRRGSEFPYGNRFEANKCNVAGNRNSPAESGNFFRCESGYGAIDMSGNLSEWVSSSGTQPRAYGGSFLTEAFNSSCNSFIELERGNRYFHTGVRCCK